MKQPVSKKKLLIQQILSVMLVGVLVCGAVHILKPAVFRFNPQYLVETSVLKNKTFNTNVKEIVSKKSKIKAYLYEEHSNPIVSISFMFKEAGSSYDPKNKGGLSNLLTIMLKKGAGQYDMVAFNTKLEQNAIDFSLSNDKDDFYGQLKFIKQDADMAAELFNLALTRPTFNKMRFNQSKNDLKEKYKYQLEQTDPYLVLEAFKQLFGTHPYAKNRFGTIESIDRLSIADLRQFMKQHLTLDRLIVAISGDITRKDAENLLDKMFSKLPQYAKYHPLEKANMQIEMPDYHISRDIPHAVGMFFGKGIKRSDERFYPLVLAIEILGGGGGLNSRIQKSVRGDKGLTYGVFANLSNNDKADYILGHFTTTPENFEKLKEIIRTEWEKLGRFGVTEEELEQVKNYMIASEGLRYANIENISDTMIGMQKMNLGLDFLQKRNTYIRNVKLEEVNRVAQEYFVANNLRFITISDSKKMEESTENEKTDK